MPDETVVSRRKFFKASSLIGGGLLLSFYVPSFARGPKPTTTVDFSPNAFLRIGNDDSITVICSYAELGQGIYTAMCQMIGDELEADWSKIKVEAAPADIQHYGHPFYHAQMTGGSNSTLAEFDRMRQTGATAKAMLISAAAKTWGVGVDGLTAHQGFVVNKTNGKKISYGNLATVAATLEVPKEVKLKDPKDYHFIAKSIKRVDTKSKTNGTAIYGIDVVLPGMLVSLIARSPVVNGKMKDFNPLKALAIPGVKYVMPTSSGVAVVATGFWPAKKGIAALEVIWDDGELASFNSPQQMEDYKEMSGKDGLTAVKKGEVSNSSQASQTFNVDYEFPYLAHATMEPLNCVADVKDDGVDLYLGTQGQTFDQMVVAGMLKLKPEQVRIHNHVVGGGFGRRCMLDAHLAVEATLVSKAIKGPVKVMWTREDDIKGTYYLTASYHRLNTSIDKDGNPLTWHLHTVSQSHVFGTAFEQPLVHNNLDSFAIDGGTEIFYEVPNMLVEWTRAKNTVPTMWLRSNSHLFNGFTKETMIDRMAKATNKDPLQYRLGLLKANKRHTELLTTVAAKAGWGKPLPVGHAHGIAIHEAFGSALAMVAEVSIGDKGQIKVHKITAVINCGLAVNPANVEAQIQGSVAFALTILYYGNITLANGKVQQSNFHDYKIARMFEVPPVDVTILESKERMGGVGEACVPTVAPAIANAVLALTGKFIIKIPFPADMRKA